MITFMRADTIHVIIKTVPMPGRIAFDPKDRGAIGHHAHLPARGPCALMEGMRSESLKACAKWVGPGLVAPFAQNGLECRTSLSRLWKKSSTLR
jgi:hypothetical protein